MPRRRKPKHITIKGMVQYDPAEGWWKIGVAVWFNRHGRGPAARKYVYRETYASEAEAQKAYAETIEPVLPQTEERILRSLGRDGRAELRRRRMAEGRRNAASRS
jgi:hypothetical protein